MTATQVSRLPDAQDASAPARGYSVLDIVILVALLVAAVVYGVATLPQLLAGHLIPPTIIAIAYFVAAGVVATRWRWAVIVSLLVSLASLVLHLSPGSFPLVAITHPASEPTAFPVIVVQPPLMAMVLAASVAKLTQTLRHEPFHAPRWLSPSIGLLAGLAIGALVIGTFAQSATKGGPAVATAGTETVHLSGSTFIPNIIALHSGDTLTVVDDVPVPHILTNGSWSASGQAQPGAEQGAPAINNVNLNNNTVVIGPFTTPGTYHILCTLHPGMNLTVIVQ